MENSERLNYIPEESAATLYEKQVKFVCAGIRKHTVQVVSAFGVRTALDIQVNID